MYYWSSGWTLLKEQAVTDADAVLKLLAQVDVDSDGLEVAFDDLTVQTDAASSGILCLEDHLETFDGETLDTRYVTAGGCGVPVELDGGLVIEKLAGCIGLVSCGVSRTRLALCGDFELTVDFEIVDLPVTAVGAHFAGVHLWTLDGVEVGSVERYNQAAVDSCVPAPQTYKAFTTSSSNCVATMVPADHASGKLRIRRVGNRISMSYWDQGWNEIRAETCTDADLVPDLRVGSHNSDAGSKVVFDNLRIAPPGLRDLTP
jgi:hypothetical protein